MPAPGPVLPWYVAPRDMTAGETITLGVMTLTVGADVPAGTLLAINPEDGRLHPHPGRTPRANPPRADRRRRPA